MPEHTIAENLTRLTTARTDIADAIIAKGGTVTTGDGFEEFSADIATIPSGGGGGGTSKNDVNFYDYDGTIVESYSANDFLALSAMPDNPTHDGLTSQGWNWSLADAKAYVTAYGRLDIGQMYNTSDGALRLYIHLEEGRLSPTLGICVKGTATVNWGDNSATETMTGISEGTLVYLPHTYQTAGDYVISVLPNSGSRLGFGVRNTASSILCTKSSDNANNRRVYLNALYKVEIPSSVTSIGSSAFQYCYGLTSVTIPSSVTSIRDNAFAYCYGLTSVTIPSSVTSIDDNAFQSCYGLTSVIIPSSVTSIGSSAFQSCYGLTSLTIPSSVTSISNNAFQYCYGLTSVTIPSSVTSIDDYAFAYCYGLTSVIIPSSVTSIGSSAFAYCYGLTSVIIPSSVTSIGSSAFAYCYGLTSLTIPSSVTSISNNAFQYCYGLISLTIPSSVTSISNNAFQYCYGLISLTIPSSVTSIGSYVFQYCYGLISLTIPSSVTSISNNAFQYCYGLGFVRFLRETPPTVSSANAFSSVPTDCIIYAPALVVNLYMNGTNYPSKSTYTYVGFATYESGVTLPTTTSDETHTLTWYANIDDLKAGTNPITVGNGNEVYAKATAI